MVCPYCMNANYQREGEGGPPYQGTAGVGSASMIKAKAESMIPVRMHRNLPRGKTHIHPVPAMPESIPLRCILSPLHMSFDFGLNVLPLEDVPDDPVELPLIHHHRQYCLDIPLKEDCGKIGSLKGYKGVSCYSL